MSSERTGVGRVYLDFILKIRQLCLKHNKRVNMWGDIVLKHPEIIPSIPKDIVMFLEQLVIQLMLWMQDLVIVLYI